MHMHSMTNTSGARWDNDGCLFSALLIVVGLTLGGCGVAKCVKHFANKDKSNQAKDVAVSSNQNVMGSDTLYLNATAMNQRTK